MKNNLKKKLHDQGYLIVKNILNFKKDLKPVLNDMEFVWVFHADHPSVPDRPAGALAPGRGVARGNPADKGCMVRAAGPDRRPSGRACGAW